MPGQHAAAFAGLRNLQLPATSAGVFHYPRQQRLIADAGHELRTPLTSLRTNIELLSLDATSQMLSETDRREIFADVNAQLAEFTSLIKDLVSLARDDQVAAAPEPIDLRDVVTAALERARRRAPKGVEFDV